MGDTAERRSGGYGPRLKTPNANSAWRISRGSGVLADEFVSIVDIRIASFPTPLRVPASPGRGGRNGICRTTRLRFTVSSFPRRFLLMPPASRPPAVDRLIQRLQWDDLDVAYLRRLVEIARDEDLAGLGLRRRPARTGDLSTACVSGPPRHSAAALVARESLVACGLGLVPLVLSVYGGRVAAQFRVRDGAAVSPGGLLATLHGDPRVLLAAERTLLNFL